MTDPQAGPSSGYWYPEPSSVTSVDLLNLMRQYRAAEAAMRARTRKSMGMGDTDLLALRHLMRADQQGQALLQRDLARLLDISSASTTQLVDRLVRSGHVRREPHPTDRRATIIVPTVDSDHEVRETLGVMHRRMMAAAEAMDPTEAAAVARFLGGMIHAVEAEPEHPAP